MKWRKLERMGSKLKLPIVFVKVSKVIISYIRFNTALFTSKKRTSQHPFIIFAMPKSGSSFIEHCLEHYLKQTAIVPWKATLHEQTHGESVTYQIDKTDLKKLKRKAIFYKIHSSGMNVKDVVNEGIKAVKLTRSLEQVRDSHIRYVRKTYHHPQYANYKNKSLDECINYFDQNEAPIYKQFYVDWPVDSYLKIDNSQLKGNEFETLKKLLNYINAPFDKRELQKSISFIKADPSKTLSGNTFN